MKPSTEGKLQFDWYEGTVYEQAFDDVAYTLGRQISRVFELKPARPAMNYYHGTAITVFGRPVVTLSHGGNPGTHFKVTGQDSVQVTEIIRELFTHEVSRCDIRLDYKSPTIFDNLWEMMEELAKSRTLSIGRLGDWDYGIKGRTGTIGSRKSETFARLYEKGKKEKEDPEWVRLELEIKPKRQKTRLEVSRAPIDQLWGMSVWSQLLASELMDYTPYLIEKEVWQKSDLEKRKTSMYNQYGNTLNEMIEASVSPEMLGIQIVAELSDHRRRTRKGRKKG
jgi:hypothetical protein